MQQAKIQDDPRARSLLKEAAERTYKFPADLLGFAADIEIEINHHTWDATLVVSLPMGINLAFEGERSQDAFAWVQRELQSILGHRRPSSFDERDGRYVLTLDTTPNPCGLLISVHGDKLQSSYRVLDQAITEVHRVLPDQNFTIQILESQHIPDDWVVSKHFVVCFRSNTTSQLVRTDIYSDTYVPVGHAWLPATRRILVNDAQGCETYMLRLHNHRLLKAGDELLAA